MSAARRWVALAWLAVGSALAGCASRPDHFYTLSVLPESARDAPAATVHVRLMVNVPALVDRAEMVLNSPPNGIMILEHERWASALSDQVTQTLARDLEAHRADIYVAGRGFDQAATPPVTVKVDIVRMSVQRGGRASIDARWHIVDTGTSTDRIGGAMFDAPVPGEGFASVAQAYSRTLSELADRLGQEIARR